MSRAKVGYEFCPMPRKLHPVWAGASFYTRGLLWSLFALNDGAPIAVTGDWMTSLCKQLEVHGRDRSNMRKALHEWVALGALEVVDGQVRIAFRTDDKLHPNCTQTAPKLHPNYRDSSQTHDIPLESSPRNDSAPILQTDRREETEEREMGARTREDLVGFKWYCSSLGLVPTSAPSLGSWRDEYADMGRRPEAERAKVAAAIAADPWCQANPHLVSPGHVRKHWQKYLGGPERTVLKQMVATPREQLTEAREAAREAAIAVNRMLDAPWFDKEERYYEQNLKNAQATLAAAQAKVSEMMRSERIRAAS